MLSALKTTEPSVLIEEGFYLGGGLIYLNIVLPKLTKKNFFERELILSGVVNSWKLITFKDNYFF